MSKKEPYVDPRVRRTRHLLRSALIELIPEKGYENIRIQDITDRATLNRATFYLHYRDKDDLLERGFNEIWDRLTAKDPLPVVESGHLSTESTHAAVVSDFEHLAEHVEFYRVMLGKSGVAAFIHRLQEHIYASSKERLKAVRNDLADNPLPVEMVLRFIAAAYVGLMQWWLDSGMPYTPEEMADLFVQLYATSPFEALGLPRPPES